MSEYVDVDIIENGKVIGTFKCRHVTEEKKDEMKNKISMAIKDPILQQGFEVICKENEQLRADYEKQKEINKELVDDIAELHKRIRELETQIKQANEREAQDIRARFPC